MATPPELESEEIEVTKIIERLDNVEKENSDQKAKIAELEKTIGIFGASIDRIADLIGKRG